MQPDKIKLRTDCPKGNLYILNPNYVRLVPNPPLVCDSKRQHGVIYFQEVKRKPGVITEAIG